MVREEIDEKYKPEIKSYDENADAPILNKKSAEQLLGRSTLPAALQMFGLLTSAGTYKPDINSHLYNLFAPPINFSGLPPTVFQVAGMDPLRDEALLYERLLREEHGTKTQLYMYQGLPHGFWSFFPDMKVSKKLIDDTIQGLGWLLGQK